MLSVYKVQVHHLWVCISISIMEEDGQNLIDFETWSAWWIQWVGIIPATWTQLEIWRWDECVRLIQQVSASHTRAVQTTTTTTTTMRRTTTTKTKTTTTKEWTMYVHDWGTPVYSCYTTTLPGNEAASARPLPAGPPGRCSSTSAVERGTHRNLTSEHIRTTSSSCTSAVTCTFITNINFVTRHDASAVVKLFII